MPAQRGGGGPGAPSGSPGALRRGGGGVGCSLGASRPRAPSERDSAGGEGGCGARLL